MINLPITLIRKRLYNILESKERHSKIHKYFDISFLILILCNVIFIALETVEGFDAYWYDFFYIFELFSVTVFTIEYLIRVWASIEAELRKAPYKVRFKYVFSPLGLIDLLAILPFYLAFLGIDLRYLRVLRLMRIFKLAHYFDGLTMLIDVISEEADALLATVFIMLVMLIVAASGIYLVEHDIQPDKFGSVPESMWWAVVTLTTVGYGDVTPITPAGKVFSAFITVIGIGMAALPAGILASGMNNQMHKKSQKLSQKYSQAIADGVIDATEQIELDDLRKTLGLSKRQAKAIFDELQKKSTNGTLPTLWRKAPSMNLREFNN